MQGKVKEPSAAVELIMTAIFHCGHEEAARLKGNQAYAGFQRVPPAGAI